MKDLAPEIVRKRMLIEGYYTTKVDEKVIRQFFEYITKELKLRTYAPPIIHCADGMGKKENSGYDCFVPLIDSGIYLGVWGEQRFFSLVLYTCKDFDEKRAVSCAKKFFKSKEVESLSF